MTLPHYKLTVLENIAEKNGKCWLTLSQKKIFTLPNWKSLQMTISNFIKMSKSSPDGLKTVWEKEKLLVTQFLLFLQVFNRLVLLTCKNQGLFGKWLTLSQTSPDFDVSAVQVFWKHYGRKSWLIVLGFNTTLTAKVISWRSVTHLCFLAFSHQY